MERALEARQFTIDFAVRGAGLLPLRDELAHVGRFYLSRAQVSEERREVELEAARHIVERLAFVGAVLVEQVPDEFLEANLVHARENGAPLDHGALTRFQQLFRDTLFDAA